MDHARSSRKIRTVAGMAFALAAAVAWSHVGSHTPVNPPPPIKVPKLSPGVFGKGDPTVNQFDSTTGLSSGGIAYTWTIDAVGNLNAALTGVVGASSWRDSESLSSGEGWTRASSWVALRLRSPTRVTVRLSRAQGVVDPLGILPGETGGNQLIPAIAIYAGWQETGSEETRYPNDAPIPWASALAYHSHFEDEGNGEVTGTFELSAGLYSIVLGGIGGDGFDLGRQGYVANFSLLSRALPASILTKGSRFVAQRETYRLNGRFKNPGSAALLAVQQNRRTRFISVMGSAWTVTISRLKPGTNHVYLAVISRDGRLSARRRISIIR